MPVFVAEVFRREPQAGTERAMAQRNVRVPVAAGAIRTAPDPVRYGEFYGQGRAPGQDLPHGKQQRYVALNIAEIQSVQQDDFEFGKHVLRNDVRDNRGLQAALVERANIHRPESRAYGSIYTMFGNDPMTPVYGPYGASLFPRGQ